MQKHKNNKMFPLMCLVMKMKQNMLSTLQNKILQKILIYYYYWVLKISIMFWLKVLIGLWLIKQKHHDKKHLWWYCLQCSLAQALYLQRHVKHWLKNTKSDLLNEEYEYVHFEYLKRLTKVPFITFGGFIWYLNYNINTLNWSYWIWSKH